MRVLSTLVLVKQLMSFVFMISDNPPINKYTVQSRYGWIRALISENHKNSDLVVRVVLVLGLHLTLEFLVLLPQLGVSLVDVLNLIVSQVHVL